MTFRTTFRDTRSSRQIALIDLPCPKNARRIFAIVSTISIPTSAPIIMEASVDPQPPGSRLDADHPENGVLIPRRTTALSASRYNPALKAFSNRLAGADKKSKVIIVAVMRKMITTLNAMLRDNAAWQLKPA